VAASAESTLDGKRLMKLEIPSEAEAVLADLAAVFETHRPEGDSAQDFLEDELPNAEAKYRALLEQVPAVVFMAYLDRGIGEAYVSPQIEASLGFRQEEWLEDPVRWYQQIHPEDKQRWSVEAAEMFLSGKGLRSAYRVMARDGRVIWFHCEAKMMRHRDGRPWFIHGVAFDISHLKQTEQALQEERNVLSALLDTLGALVVVLDPEGRIIRFNRACEQVTGYSFTEVEGRKVWELFMIAGEAENFESGLREIQLGNSPKEYESQWITRAGDARLISWSSTVLPRSNGWPAYIIATGIDITERKRLEKSILEVSAREQRRIGQDLHDGLGQHLTGIAFMSKVQQQKLSEQGLPEAQDAAKIVHLVNEAIHKTKELARGLLPVMSDAHGLMAALQQCAVEIREVFGVECRFRCEPPVLVNDINLATHLYHIAQEAINNAIRHGKARMICVDLSRVGGQCELSICDDGVGLGDITGNSGMGLQIMSYRARMIGGSLEIERATGGGTIVRCAFPVPKSEGAQVG